jgi:hypothetical protein
MATATRFPSAQGAQVMRDAWRKGGGVAGSAVGRVFAFLTAYPPLAQGLYYLLTGLWPLVSVSTYERATGHLGDTWLVQAVGVLVLVIGGTLCLAAYRRQGSPEVLFLAFGSALGMTAIDIHLAWRGYSPLYLVDAVLELGLVAFWVYGWRNTAHSAAPPQAIPMQASAPQTTSAS